MKVSLICANQLRRRSFAIASLTLLIFSAIGVSSATLCSAGTAGPADPGKRVDQGRARNREGSAHSCFARAILQRSDDLIDFFLIEGKGGARPSFHGASQRQGRRQPVLESKTARIAQARRKLKRAIHRAASLCPSVRSGSEKQYLSTLQIDNDGKQVWQRSTKAVQLPNDQTIAIAKIVQATFQPGSLILCTGRLGLVEITFVHAGGDKCIALQVDRLPVVGS